MSQGDISFLFGTVSEAHDTDAISNLKCVFDNTPSLRWVRETVSELPSFVKLLTEKLTSIDDSFTGQQMLYDFDRWLREGFDQKDEPIVLKNTILLPLVIIVGLTEFWHYVESKNPEHKDLLQAYLTPH
ncbi:hypothetical protein F5Y19DRAFT_485673 [Xylariaceae sp. FL1651]|nr:hypothetical protein F5Y19DRAFT_485673 [Xylariaceae sp. FL1651]